MAKAYPLDSPPEDSAESWIFKRWFCEVFEFLISRIKLTTETTTYTVKADVFYVRGDATSGAFAVTLPTALNSQGRQLLIKKIDVSANAVTVTRAGTDTIEGANTVVLGAQWDKTLLISNGVDTWEIV